jgi:uncharacterized protein DUF4234
MTPYYRVGTTKLALLSLCTFGLYGIYWFYRQWEAERQAQNATYSAGIRAIFSLLTAHSLFSSIHASLVSDGDRPAFSPGLYALAYFVLAIAWRLPDPLNLVGFLWFVPIIPIQKALNENVRKHDPRASLNETWEWWAFLLASAGGVLFLLAVLGTLLPDLAE